MATLASAQAPPDTLQWTGRKQVFRSRGCSGRKCSSVELSWPEFRGNQKATARVKELLLLSLGISERGPARLPTIAAVAGEFLRDARSAERDGLPWDASRTIAVLCNTPSRVLLETGEYSFTGGAHGSGGTTLTAFDPTSGAVLTPDEMLPPVARATSLPAIERAFRREHEVAPTASLSDAGFTFVNNKFELSSAILGVCGSSLYVRWNAYAIGPYAMGAPSLTIPLDSVPALRR
jgi:hypothetical protein